MKSVRRKDFLDSVLVQSFDIRFDEVEKLSRFGKDTVYLFRIVGFPKYVHSGVHESQSFGSSVSIEIYRNVSFYAFSFLVQERYHFFHQSLVFRLQEFPHERVGSLIVNVLGFSYAPNDSLSCGVQSGIEQQSGNVVESFVCFVRSLNHYRVEDRICCRSGHHAFYRSFENGRNHLELAFRETPFNGHYERFDLLCS